jgi:hypothetical protein
MPDAAASRPSPAPPPADARRVVIGDLHGDHRGLQKLLRHIGVIDWNGKRQPGYHVWQLGDLVHVGPGTVGADIITMELVHKGWVDIVLLGNHELMHAHGLSCGWFLGIDEEAELVGPLLKNMVDHGQLRPAAAVDGWLLSHAGLMPRYARKFVDEGAPDAGAVAARLNDAFDEALASPGGIPAVFSSIGPIRSGGQDLRPGGIFWADASEMKGAADENTLPQIFGHTPQPGFFPRRLDERLWVVDVGAALSGVVVALVKDPEEKKWKPVVTGAGK